MYQTKKLWYSIGWIATIVAMLVLVACSGAPASEPQDGASPSVGTESGATPEPTAPAEEALPEVELTWYVPQGEMQTDYAAVEQAINEYIKPKINATLKLKPIIFASYPEKMNTIISAGEAFDLLWVANWSFIYQDVANKGALLELDGLLDEYGAEFRDSLPDVAWEDVKLDGKIYGVPNYQIAASTYGFAIQKQYAEKYNLDTSAIKSFADLEPFLETIKQNEPDLIPYTTDTDFRGTMYGYLKGPSEIHVKAGDPTYTVVDYVQTPEFMQHYERLHSWYNKGYINKDAATTPLMDTLKTGKVVVRFEPTLKPGGEVEEKLKNGGNDVVFAPLWEVEFTGVTSTMTAISKTSKNPERAMMFLNLVNTDPTLFNLLANGVEGKHYEKLDEKTIRIVKEGGYAPNADWVFGNVTNGYLQEGKAPDTWEKTIEMNETAKVPPLYGFKYDKNPVKTEEANIAAVTKEFRAAVFTGTVDPKEYIPKWTEARKKAGIDVILAEQQRQLDAWLKEKGMK
ncbi:DUF3502 domain-containing protein [Paenibacillus antri]|uniref:DUF3502 domain-containing protein n=1 Tax=Paenibacillus antri TaxID=2582848 RepID=A0A5R9GC22_9BACL|nr:ABC transporter substrate-binding protein [Paenibacillus antri]TLS51876.1 DUF3502 domain-containing protein [Paenibacillus antri]